MGTIPTFFYCLFTTCETFRNLDYFDNSQLTFATIGIPAWADDGSDDVVGTLEFSQEVIIIPPLQGFFGRGNFRYTVQLQENLDSGPSMPTQLYDTVYRRQFGIFIYYMKSAGYVAIQTLRQPFENRAVLVVGVDGQEWGQYRDQDLGNANGRFFMMPSRDGSLIAAASWIDDFENAVNGVWEASFLVMFLSTAGESLTPIFDSPAEFSMNVSSFALYFSWAMDGSDVFTITDFDAGAVEVDGAGAVTQLSTVSNCTTSFPPTSSGLFRATDNAMITLAPGGESYDVDLTPTLPDIVCPN